MVAPKIIEEVKKGVSVAHIGWDWNYALKPFVLEERTSDRRKKGTSDHTQSWLWPVSV